MFVEVVGGEDGVFTACIKVRCFDNSVVGRDVFSVFVCASFHRLFSVYVTERVTLVVIVLYNVTNATETRRMCDVAVAGDARLASRARAAARFAVNNIA